MLREPQATEESPDAVTALARLWGILRSPRLPKHDMWAGVSATKADYHVPIRTATHGVARTGDSDPGAVRDFVGATVAAPAVRSAGHRVNRTVPGAGSNAPRDGRRPVRHRHLADDR